MQNYKAGNGYYGRSQNHTILRLQHATVANRHASRLKTSVEILEE
jgi:hypothetical protein